MEQQPNIAETLANEMKKPIEIISIENVRRVALPHGWKLEEKDDEKYLPAPRRKRASVSLNDKDSFINYVKRHGSLVDSTVWCNADYAAGTVSFLSILNDNGEDDVSPAWRDHLAKFAPRFSEEWNRWTKNNGVKFGQAEFAIFIEENLTDIATAENGGCPTGAQMLEMALSFEANQDMRFKSAIRLQNGGVQINFVQDDDDQTLARMQLFDRFSIGIPVFWNGDAYRIDARLRYRARDGKVMFWFELLRHDKTLEAAAKTLVEEIRAGSGVPFFFGDPFAK